MNVFKNFHDTTIYFAKIQGVKIVNENRVVLGRLLDFFVNYEEVYPQVMAIQFKMKGHYFYVNWSDIIQFNYQEIIIRNDSDLGRARTYPKMTGTKVSLSILASQFKGTTVEYPPLGKVVLDRQIVDTFGKKVVRVNDIQFVKAGPHLRVVYACIGFKSMLRRLGFTTVIDPVIQLLHPKAEYLNKEALIHWKYVHAIADRTFKKNVRVSLANEELQKIHPADLADILEDLDGHARETLFSHLAPELAAETLLEMDEDIQKVLVRNEDPEDLAKILENMGPDEAADILQDLDQAKVEDIMEKISDQEIKEDIEDLLIYQENTAGGIMSTELFQIGPESKKFDILIKIRNEYDSEQIENLTDIYVVDENESLLGVCPLTRILMNDGNIRICDLMETHDLKSLRPETHWKEVAKYMSKYSLTHVPVTSENQTLLGVIYVDDMLPWLLGE